MIKSLGKKQTRFAGFDTFPKPAHTNIVTAMSDEVTALCPVTTQPDWYTVTVKYYPKALCLESKTLKLYFHSLRNQGMFCEDLATKIASDIAKAIKPISIHVTIVQKPRGGISITACANL